LSDELERLLEAFEATVRSGWESKYMIKGPRAELRWFSQHRRGRDVWRVSEYVAENTGELPTDDREGEAIVDGF